jgi:outer membrane protein assembly factor BamB
MIKPRAGSSWFVAAIAVGTVIVGAGPARAQLGAFIPDSRFELDDTVQLQLADNAVRTQLQRVDAYLDDEQWDQAVETLRQVMETAGDRLLELTERRYVCVRHVCQLKLAGLPQPALELYRGRVDPLAKRWYDKGVSERDREPLTAVVEQMLPSTWGDDALLALGDLSLQSGDEAAARNYWGRIVPVDPPPDVPRTWLNYPDTDLSLASVRARLVLASILVGAEARAADELQRLEQLHGDARGHLAGREVDFVEALGQLLAESRTWPTLPQNPDWPTFAGAAGRNRIAPPVVDVGKVAWRRTLRPKPAAEAPAAAKELIPRVAEDAAAPLSFHPVAVGDLVLACDARRIWAFDARTGKAAWGEGEGVIYRDMQRIGPIEAEVPPDALGVPRYTMTVHGDRLYARMGSPVTTRPQQASSGAGSWLVCLDLKAEGRLVWKIEPDDDTWAFEGAPLCDGGKVYAAMRRSDIRPQAHVACFSAETGRQLWRRFVCSAETPARATLHEATHQLLTLAGEELFYNTNLGAVGALSTGEGRLRWVALYPRAVEGDLLKPPPYLSRDLNPCVYHRGTLFVAPADSPRIFALDAASGQILWQTGTQTEGAVHLLGVAGKRLIACGEKLYWIGLSQESRGRIERVWPDGPEEPGYGRGVMAGDSLWWCSRERLMEFDRQSGALRRSFPLRPRGTTGGNLVVARNRLLIATPWELVSLSATGSFPADASGDLAALRFGRPAPLRNKTATNR